jgi:hypothetical protein
MNNVGTIETFIGQGGLFPIDRSESDDLFLTCASFEERSTGLVECMAGNYQVKQSAIYINSEFYSLKSTQNNAKVIKEKLERVSQSCRGVSLGSWGNAVDQFRTLRKLVAPNGVCTEPALITIDITTFNRESLISCLALLQWAYPRGRVRLAYVSPKEYNPAGKAMIRKLEIEHQKNREQSESLESSLNDSEIQKHLWLSRGFRCLRNAIGFPGLQRQNLPALLILLPGYEIERALTIVNAIEPVQVMLGKPTDATRDEFYERSLNAKTQMVRLFKSRQPVIEFDFSCKSIDVTFRAIMAVAEKYYGNYNIYLTSLSTKPTLVAMFLAALKLDRIQVTCSVPSDYNVDDYSAGSHEVSFFELPHA